jgi:DNA-binding NarL/FixJ family response regulator
VTQRVADTDAAHERLGLEFLTAALALSLWVAAGSLALAIADGLGEHPVRRAVIGAGLVAVFALALWQRRRLCAQLRERPAIVVGITVALLLATLADQRHGGPYVAVSFTSIGLAAVAARARTVWLCVALLDLGAAVAIFSAHPPAELADEGDLGGVLGLLVTYPVVAALLLGLRRLLTRFTEGADAIVLELRAGAPTLTPELGRAITHPPPMLPPPSAPEVHLTPAEIRVVEGLAHGFAPKQLAREMGVVLATVRTHIRNAKRKTGARTLRELAAVPTHPDWPNVNRLRG